MLRRHLTKLICLLPLLVVAQGYVVFLAWGTSGPFLSFFGLKCTFTPLVAEGMFLIVCMMHFDRIASTGGPNPHSPLGRGIHAPQPVVPPAPPVRSAWDGDWGGGGDLKKDH